ncbi:hypothetical protein Vadar_027761 [Vaccinium darrowii]|uniref:Uncharacterized protein n=1 Tax=Vaccinium darrowii TaxID=229202 RepID=A0ACB7Y3J5_9ERIC|nr:hypothetical protein Vadar_027761 [Vaccinium darrowii]
MKNGFWIDPIGLSGGLGIFWNNSVCFEVSKFGSFFIDVKVKCLISSVTWHLINVYLSPEDCVRYTQFQTLIDHVGSLNSEVVIWGDFNDILDAGEKRGGLLRDRWSFIRFQSFVEDCGLADLGFKGYPFTWRNNRAGVDFIESRLDRALVSSQWLLNNNQASLEHLDCVGSDHKALLLNTMPESRKHITPFRFDARWFEHEKVRRIIEEQWDQRLSGSQLFCLVQKVKCCRLALRSWRVKQKLNSKRVIDETNKEIKVLETAGREFFHDKITALEDKVAREWEKEENYWRQKSHQKGLQLGDRNTSYFHACTAERRRRNHISGIEDTQGVWLTDQNSMMAEFQNYFAKLFSSEGIQHTQQVTSLIPRRVITDMNNNLVKPCTSEEIKAALFEMHPSKSPGYDGMTAGFFQRYWDIV